MIKVLWLLGKQCKVFHLANHLAFAKFATLILEISMFPVLGLVKHVHLAFIKKKIERCINLEIYTKCLFPQKVKHSKLADGVEQALQNKKIVGGVDVGQLDMCYPAIVQSGGKYSLKFSTVRSGNDSRADRDSWCNMLLDIISLSVLCLWYKVIYKLQAWQNKNLYLWNVFDMK